MVGKAGGYIGKTAQIPIFASKEGKLCDIAKKIFPFFRTYNYSNSGEGWSVSRGKVDCGKWIVLFNSHSSNQYC